MKILVVHNRYSIAAGEDAVVLEEVEMLRREGHAVIEYMADNRSIRGAPTRAIAALECVFSVRAFMRLRKLVRAERPDVVHVHNFFPLISPAVFFACWTERVPVVFTLHNFRIICPTATLQWGGQIEERSLTHGPWWAVSARVYRGSLLGSFFLTLMVWTHRRLGTWRNRVNRFVVLTDFAKAKFAQAGLPVERMVVKPNFVREPGVRSRGGQGYFLYAGRITAEKGVPELLDALRTTSMRLRVAGHADETLLPSSQENIHYLGKLERSELEHEISGAIAVVLPSKWYEGFPRVLVEAYSIGVPVIASDIGSLRELVKPGVTGLLVQPGSPDSLRCAMQWATEHPEQMRRMGLNARARYEALYQPEANYELLKDIYAAAIREGAAASRTS